MMVKKKLAMEFNTGIEACVFVELPNASYNEEKSGECSGECSTIALFNAHNYNQVDTKVM